MRACNKADLASNLLGGLSCLRRLAAISSIPAAACSKSQLLHRTAQASNVCLLHRILRFRPANACM